MIAPGATRYVSELVERHKRRSEKAYCRRRTQKSKTRMVVDFSSFVSIKRKRIQKLRLVKLLVVMLTPCEKDYTKVDFDKVFHSVNYLTASFSATKNETFCVAIHDVLYVVELHH
jgi:hypothetical protein